MKIFFLDLASNSPTMHIVTEKETIASRSVEDTKDEQALMPLFHLLLKDAHLTPEDLTHIACVTGPGGFMTIRVGVALANALSFALDIPSCGMHLSDVWKERAGDHDAVWLHSTRRTQLFIRGLGTYATEWPEPTLIDLDRLHVENVPFVGELLPEQEEAMHAVRLETFLPLEEALPRTLPGLPYAKEPLEPWYGRGIE